MNFFKAQDKARKHTTRLIILFSLAVIILVILTNILIFGTFAYMQVDETTSFLELLKSGFEINIAIAISVGISLLILLGSIYKVISLSKGGAAVAEMLGGKLISQSTTELNERTLLNIVEEMSIAAGMSIPKVYMLDESSINAFAAGQSNNNAVIGVTRGAIELLSRDELQGVIAHEFSHILNGDMRINIRLIGILHGILLIGIIGGYLLRSMRYSSGKKNNGGALIAIGVGLFVIGYTGTFFGRWIKASISRQREFLADASAVQFTRNKDTIAGALKKIGGLDKSSLLETPSASEYSHAYFANGVSSFLGSMFSTHPPLEDRIKQIDPAWDGNFITPKPADIEVPETKEESSSIIPGFGIATPVILAAIDQVMQQIGTVSKENIEYAQQILLNIPDTLKTAAQSAFSARAVVYSLLIREQTDKKQAWELLQKHAAKEMPVLTKDLYEKSKELDESLILPLLELSVNSLRELSLKQYEQFKLTINKIIISDQSVDLNEWIIQRLILQHLDEHFAIRKPAKEKYSYLGAVKDDAELLFSLIAYTEHKDDQNAAKQAFELGINEIGTKAFKFISKDEISLAKLNNAIDQLMQLKPILKSRILKACATIIMADGETTRKGIELFRTISSCLDTPVPPLKN